MNSSQKKRSKVTSAIRSEKQNADPSWNAENQQLQSQAQANNRLRQQITKESYADSAIQADIKDKITNLKQKAVQIAQKLQSQKRKNIQLQAIIKHMILMRDKEKVIQATFRDDMNFQNLDNLSRKIKKYQYDLEQMFAKLNDMTSKNKEKKSQVDAFRTQRVIDSGIFLKIQKQIVQYETDYKKLLIQKTKFEQQYKKNLQNYKKMKSDIQKQQYISLSKRSSSQKPDNNQQQFFQDIPQIEHAVKFTQINNQPKRKSFYNTKKTLTAIQNKRQQVLQQMQYAVKKVFMQTGFDDEETLYQHLMNIENINQQLFNQVNRDTDRINSLQQQISAIRSKRQSKTIKYYQKQPQLTKTQIRFRQSLAIQQQIARIQSNSSKISKVLQEFMKSNELKKMKQISNLQVQNQFQLQNIQQVFASLEIKLQNIFSNYAQYKKNLIQSQQRPLNRVYESQSKQETIQQLISKVKKVEQSEKIMMKQDFKKQYENIRKYQNSNKGRTGKKKTTFLRKY